MRAARVARPVNFEVAIRRAEQVKVPDRLEVRYASMRAAKLKLRSSHAV